jgi:2-dehydro-3-deoxy-D-gluconate 5-dehydrogenase
MAGILDLFKLDGKAAIVTGSERGLGQGYAIALAQAGADILGVTYADEADETAAAVKAAGRKYVHLKANLMSLEPIPGVIKTALEKFGHIDILVNNAGNILRNEAIDFTEREWDDVMNLNLKTVFFLSQAVAKEMIHRGKGGKIINIASMLSFQGGIRVPSYTASKSGVKGITMAMANEWAKHNIQINAVAPGYIETMNTAPIRADEERMESITARIPAGRWGLPSDVSPTVVFLASSASDYLNGTVVAVDGGWLAR